MIQPDLKFLTSADPEPPQGTVVSTPVGIWWRDGGPGPCEWFPIAVIFDPDRHDPESWTKVAGNYGPATVLYKPTGRRSCPLGSCDWHHDEPDIAHVLQLMPMPDEAAIEDARIMLDADPAGTLDGDINLASFATMMRYNMRLEAILRGHFETHPLADWVLEVQRLRAENDQLAGELGSAAFDDWQAVLPHVWVRAAGAPGTEVFHDGAAAIRIMTRRAMT
jgi:hypothetical protein